jgi:acetyl esterase
MPEEKNIKSHRREFAGLWRYKLGGSSVDVPYRDFKIGGYDLPIRIYRPKGIKPPYPTLFYSPGTGFCAFSVKFPEAVCSNLALMAECQVIILNHRLAPENKHPAAVQDTYRLLKYFLQNSAGFKIDPAKVAIAGYSSGGYLAIQAALMAQRNDLDIARLIAISPMTDLSQSLQSHQEFEEVDRKAYDGILDWFIDLYLEDGEDRKKPCVSPFWHPADILSKLPATDLVVAEHDALRSDVEEFHSKLQTAGVEVRKLVIPSIKAADGSIEIHAQHSNFWQDFSTLEKIARILREAFCTTSVPRGYYCRDRPR